MKLTLTNVGHRRSLSLPRKLARGVETPSSADKLLLQILENPPKCVPSTGSVEERELLHKGFAKLVPDSTPTREIKRILLRNPLENVTALAIEFTTRCNFHCGHCYNANVERVTETNYDALAAATDAFCDMGVRRFAFIGGEVTRYGDRWLELAIRLRERGATIVGILTNGWWLEASDFEAAGRRYATAADYLADLREHGVTHIGFSVDGREQDHDRSRNSPGLYRRILAGFATVRAAGILPRVSLVLRSGGTSADESSMILELAGALYPKAGSSPEELVTTLLRDRTNIISGFVDFGNGAGGGNHGPWSLRNTDDRLLRCAGFYRPAPQLTIKANGEISTCRLASAGDGYGNIHDGEVVETLNRIPERFIYRLHAERRIGEYRNCVDPSVFGKRFGSICTLRAIVTMVARKMHEAGVESGDSAAVARINREVALITGHFREDAACL